MQTIHSDLFPFLKELKLHNNKDWFDANRKRYDAIRKQHILFVGDLIKECSSFEKELEELDPSKCIFRINRDVRFSKDKSPYKTNMGAWMNIGGKQSNLAGFYLHLDPEEMFLAGGMYMPMPEQLKVIRQEIDYNLSDFKDILSNKNFVKNFQKLGGSQLVNAPKDYPKDHPGIEYLKHKDFIVNHPISEEIASSPDFVQYCGQVYKALNPLNQFLNNALGDLKSDKEE